MPREFTTPRVLFYMACTNAALALIEGAQGAERLQRARALFQKSEPRTNPFTDHRQYISPRIIRALEGGQGDAAKSASSSVPETPPTDRPPEPIGYPVQTYVLRSEPAVLSRTQLRDDLRQRGIYDSNENRSAKPLTHDFVVLGTNNERVVFDRKTGLMWHQEWPLARYPPAEARRRLQRFNARRYGGYADWRLPTIEELLSLSDYYVKSTPYPLLAKCLSREAMASGPPIENRQQSV